MSNYNNFVFYGGWREVLEGYREDFGDEYAKETLWNLMLMATAGDIETDKKSIINFVHGACMPNIEAAQDRYEKAQLGGQKGGRPKLLSDLDEKIIATLRKEGRTAVQIGQILGVSEKTIRCSNGWKEYKTYECAADKTDKTDPKTQKPEIDIDIEKEKDKDIENLSVEDMEVYLFEYDCFLRSGKSKEEAKRLALELVNEEISEKTGT